MADYFKPRAIVPGPHCQTGCFPLANKIVRFRQKGFDAPCRLQNRERVEEMLRAIRENGGAENGVALTLSVNRSERAWRRRGEKREGVQLSRRVKAVLPGYRSPVKRPGTMPSRPTPGGVIQASLQGEGAAGLQPQPTGQPHSPVFAHPRGFLGPERSQLPGKEQNKT